MLRFKTFHASKIETSRGSYEGIDQQCEVGVVPILIGYFVTKENSMVRRVTLAFSLMLCLKVTVQAQTCGTDTVSLNALWEYATGLSLPIHVAADESNPEYIYVAAKSGGVLVLDVSDPAGATLAATITVSSFSNLEAMYCEQYGNYLYVALGNYFGTDVQQAGLAIVNITEPDNPVVEDVWENETTVKGCAVVKAEGSYAYLGAMTDGLIILDISDKSNIQFVSKLIPDPDWPVVNPTPTATPNARGMALKGDVLYLCYDAGGLRIINVADKQHPVETGRYINQEALEKQQAYNDIEIHGELAYIGVDYCGLEIVNVSDTSNITQTGWWDPWDCTSPSNIWIGSHGHGNEVHLDTALQVVFISAGASDLRIVDVSDPIHPDSCSGFGSFTDSLAAYAATVSGDRIFLSYIFAFIPYFSVWAGVKEVQWHSSMTPVVELTSGSGISVYPNPFTRHITINGVSDVQQTYEVKVFNSMGSVIKHENVKEDHKGLLFLELPEVPPGVYLVSVQSEQSIFSVMAVKKE